MGDAEAGPTGTGVGGGAPGGPGAAALAASYKEDGESGGWRILVQVAEVTTGVVAGVVMASGCCAGWAGQALSGGSDRCVA